MCNLIDQEEYQNEEQSQGDDSQDQYHNPSDQQEQHAAGNGANGSGPTGDVDHKPQCKELRAKQRRTLMYFLRVALSREYVCVYTSNCALTPPPAHTVSVPCRGDAPQIRSA